MTTTCQYCGTPMQALRSTRKYCSDTCKQLAFYKRNGLALADADTNTSTGNEPAVLLEEAKTDANKPDYLVRQQDQPYQQVYSRLLEAVQECLDSNNYTFIFENPDQYWGTYGIQPVKWVSLRLRCLLENMLRLSNIPSIPNEALVLLRDSFADMAAAHPYRQLPADYPYTALVKDIIHNLDRIVYNVKPKGKTRFRLTLKRKAALIACRFTLAAMVPLVKFRELNFSE
ncbi:hypothetical protein [Chitinophaga rhizophila]|uniref:Uncharacterized protein n=1 Tax=Chitinophaga rhizophila TaxID=2866212 RepID=A0ABS7G7U8_9BACT|nr:hypothetical protein [Chitinophaga rhizophila]MBW8683526.1 hypothetical protein [Chitinophaga rhizophila]